MKTGKALLGILTGMVAGAAVGMLFAPHKGKKTRNKISKKTKELADTINQNIDVKVNDLLKGISKAVGHSASASKSSQPEAVHPEK